jgi:hypothetical protein
MWKHSLHGYAGETTPNGPSRATTPCLSLRRASISEADLPCCRSTNMSLIVAMSRNSLPLSPDVPVLPNSSSACAWRRLRDSRTPSVALLRAEGKCGAENCCAGGSSGPGDAIDDGEKVGFGCATPICFSRLAKSAVMVSGRSGLIEAATMSMSAC